jgi:GNAT superfamily N-acetyltransferase
MSLNEQSVYVSDIDEDRFGIRTAKSAKVTVDNLPKIMDFCQNNNVKMLIARCPTNDFPAIHAMEGADFLLMDTLVYYSMDLKHTPIPLDNSKVTIRKVQLGEENKVKAVAAESFRGYFGHYHADERLNNSKCDEVYVSWAVNSCVSRDFADDVLVIELRGRISGFISLRFNTPEEGEVGLFCVDPSAQNRGFSQSLLIGALKWCVSQGAKRLVISTQIINISSQKAFTLMGFVFRDSYYTFHKWFD